MRTPPGAATLLIGARTTEVDGMATYRMVDGDGAHVQALDLVNPVEDDGSAAR
jgi:hypothetical protein